MIYTIGLPCMSGMEPLETGLAGLSGDDAVVINVKERYFWQGGFAGSEYLLKDILPNTLQRELLRDFLRSGGTIFTSLVEPSKPIFTTAFREELASIDLNCCYLIEGEQDVLSLGVMPYDWLEPEWSTLPIDAYRKFQEINDLQVQSSISRSSIVSRNSVEAIAYRVERDGQIIFTPLLNSFLDNMNIMRLLDLVKQFLYKKETV